MNRNSFSISVISLSDKPFAKVTPLFRKRLIRYSKSESLLFLFSVSFIVISLVIPPVANVVINFYLYLPNRLFLLYETLFNALVINALWAVFLVIRYHFLVSKHLYTFFSGIAKTNFSFYKTVVSPFNFRFLSEIELVKGKYVWRFMQSWGFQDMKIACMAALNNRESPWFYRRRFLLFNDLKISVVSMYYSGIRVHLWAKSPYAPFVVEN